MSHQEFEAALGVLRARPSFNALLMAAMRTAETADQIKLEKAFPATFKEMIARTNTADGRLPSDAK